MKDVTIPLGELPLEALQVWDERTGGVAPILEQSVRYYLSDGESRRPGWEYPRFRRDRPLEEGTNVEVRFDDRTWSGLVEEAERQGVDPERLLRHAALYFIADLDSGRVIRRMLERTSGRG